ncbi:cytosine deaminase [Paenibacillus beijingensis]|uniref:Cytosine deaminase n=1 Tax=Paenibacillus beijingensis TaxID=1126833 RepID=A0A0D5NRI8_9BACL|nr:cytosine deaminase [Paenibacillus beijingensis]
MDLLIQGARLPGAKQFMDVGVKDGVITCVAPAGEQAIDAVILEQAHGAMLLPGVVEPHIHLDKSHLLSRMSSEATSLQEAIRMTAELKQGFTREDIWDRSLATIQQAVRNGVTHMRCHAEVDPILGLKSVEVALELKSRVKSWMDLQIVVLPQEGIFQAPGTDELMEEALRLGVDVVGGMPYQDADPGKHIDYVFKLGEKYKVPIDFHTDFSDNPEDRTILDIADRTIASEFQGLVSAGHVTSLGSMPVSEACRAIERIAQADISIMCLPATDLYISGRGDREKIRRGLTPVKLLLEHGVNVTVGVNNVRNAFTPFGKADPFEVAWLLAVAAYMGSEADARQLVHMLTSGAARALGLHGYGLHIGAYADMVLFPTSSSERDILLDQPACRKVWKRGVKVAEAVIPTGPASS